MYIYINKYNINIIYYLLLKNKIISVENQVVLYLKNK